LQALLIFLSFNIVDIKLSEVFLHLSFYESGNLDNKSTFPVTLELCELYPISWAKLNDMLRLIKFIQ